jgi:hypothetical protein
VSDPGTVWEPPDSAAAAAQLAALRADRAALAERAMQPWWYDASLGLLVFGLLASYDLPTWARLAVLVGVLAGLGGLVSVYHRRTGTWVSGSRPGPTRRAYLTWLAVAFPVFLAALFAEEVLDLDGAMVGAGAVLGAGIALVSRWWSRSFVAELRGDL